jgi:hypothetical protein
MHQIGNAYSHEEKFQEPEGEDEGYRPFRGNSHNPQYGHPPPFGNPNPGWCDPEERGNDHIYAEIKRELRKGKPGILSHSEEDLGAHIIAKNR